MIENRWIRRQTGDRQLVDVALQGYVVEDVAGDVVELETLAEIMGDLVAFMVSPRSGIRFCSQQRGEIPGEDIADVLDPLTLAELNMTGHSLYHELHDR